MTLGGPGIGKTKGKVMECISHVIGNTNKRALLVSPLKTVRNLLSANLVDAGFGRYVRVVGTIGLDDLRRV